MEKNVGGFDRTWRLVVGPVLVLAAVAAFGGLVSLSTPVAVIALVAGVVFLATGVLQTCFLNRLLGLDTYHDAGEESDASGGMSEERPQ
ncbi:Protein of unknown function [Natronoarchaeum philippinense]|uniref:Inner membrane protein YgaP-like transmembrane domain-containing protein n=1 Tax=Natronoarchaeum philippinense TaxID=558529 RepID=A0A285P7K3_NATPI|nr:DUF2892 domain-containing protein [Natronoarchaeum philippinense]SNZ17183.1 Protein of unknown function [Natronoarchaeum philippinense]